MLKYKICFIFLLLFNFIRIYSATDSEINDLLELEYFDRLVNNDDFAAAEGVNDEKIVVIKERLKNILKFQITNNQDEQQINVNNLRCSLKSVLYIDTSIDQIQYFLDNSPYLKNGLPKEYDLKVFENTEVINALNALFQEWKNEIVGAFHELEQNVVGKCLLRGIKKYNNGGKIPIIPGDFSQFIHQTGIERLHIKLNFVSNSPTLQYVGGKEAKERSFDLTLFHELLHYLHFLIDRNEYLLGLNDKNIEEQKDSILEVLRYFFNRPQDGVDIDWINTQMLLPWIRPIGMFNQENKTFLLEELRTIWGIPNSPCIFKRISETAYLISKERMDLIRIGYTSEDYPQSFLDSFILNGEIDQWIIQKINPIIGNISEECECPQCSSRSRCC